MYHRWMLPEIKRHLILTDLAQAPIARDTLSQRLRLHGLIGSEAEMLLEWCLTR